MRSKSTKFNVTNLFQACILPSLNLRPFVGTSGKAKWPLIHKTIKLMSDFSTRSHHFLHPLLGGGEPWRMLWLEPRKYGIDF